MHTAKDLRAMSVADIMKELIAARKEVYEHTLKVRVGQEVTHHKLHALKKHIARMMTVLTQKRQDSVASLEAAPVQKSDKASK